MQVAAGVENTTFVFCLFVCLFVVVVYLDLPRLDIFWLFTILLHACAQRPPASHLRHPAKFEAEVAIKKGICQYE